MKLSVIVPMLDEERAIAMTLNAIRSGAPDAEIIVVDGASGDESVAIARPLCDRLMTSPRGRARQMNAGAARASGDAFAFVHADTVVPCDFEDQVVRALADSRTVGGRFDVCLDSTALPYRLLGATINWRSRMMHSATGDQAIFVRRDIFETVGGYADIELCEDVDFIRRLRAHGQIACLRGRVITSARRWRTHGLMRTILRMWAIKSLFLIGVSPAWLKRRYLDAR